jgi:hypothetical protein
VASCPRSAHVQNVRAEHKERADPGGAEDQEYPVNPTHKARVRPVGIGCLSPSVINDVAELVLEPGRTGRRIRCC